MSVRELLRNPNAGAATLLVVITVGGGANYSKVDQVLTELSAVREAQLEQRLELRDQERRLAALERAQ